jgi:hypothetical protein
VGFGDERSHLGAVQVSGTDDQVCHPLANPGYQPVCGVTHGHNHRDGHASLTRRTEPGRDGSIGRQFHVGVGQDNHVVLGAPQSLDSLAVLRTPLPDRPGHGRGADEADGADVRMIEDGVDGLFVAVNDVEDPFGQTSFGE